MKIFTNDKKEYKIKNIQLI